MIDFNLEQHIEAPVSDVAHPEEAEIPDPAAQLDLIDEAEANEVPAEEVPPLRRRRRTEAELLATQAVTFEQVIDNKATQDNNEEIEDMVSEFSEPPAPRPFEPTRILLIVLPRLPPAIEAIARAQALPEEGIDMDEQGDQRPSSPTPPPSPPRRQQRNQRRPIATITLEEAR